MGDGGGMEDDGCTERGRTRLARGTKPLALSGQHEIAGNASSHAAAGSEPAGGAPRSAGRGPAQSIHEAVEQLIEAQEADEAIAEWMQVGG
jgi:hypothetical protein